MEKDISLFDKTGLQLIWQTGKPFLDRAKLAAANRPGVFVSDFITDMENAYAAADLVISRSGAMAVAELCIVKKPVIFVPFPHAAEDHQTVNAMNLVNEQAAMIVKDSAARKTWCPLPYRWRLMQTEGVTWPVTYRGWRYRMQMMWWRKTC